MLLMNRVLKECALDEKCSYIDGKKQKTHYRIIEHCTKEYCERLIDRGWRRFGKMFFRPICADCYACESLKIDVKSFQFSKSMRRIIKKNSSFEILVQRPSMTQEHIKLFNKYHLHMHHKRAWDLQQVNANNYYSSFVDGANEFGYEVLYFNDDKLIGVDLIDILPNSVSSIYFYYDPDYEKYSLGKYSMYRQIMYAQANDLSWIQMGYYVEGCQSLEYKASYSPHLRLIERPQDGEVANWVKV